MHCFPCIGFYALYSMHYLICIAFYALYYMHCILCVVFYALYSMKCILYIVYSFYSLYCILCIIFDAMRPSDRQILSCIVCILSIVFHACYPMRCIPCIVYYAHYSIWAFILTLKLVGDRPSDQRTLSCIEPLSQQQQKQCCIYGVALQLKHVWN